MEQALSMSPCELRALLTSPCHQSVSLSPKHLPAIKTLLSRAVPGGCATGKAMAGQGKGAKEAGRKKELHPLPAVNHPPLSPKRGHQVCKQQVEFSPWRELWWQLWVQEGAVGLGLLIISQFLCSWDDRHQALLWAQQGNSDMSAWTFPSGS